MTSHFTLSFKCNSAVIQRQYMIYLEIQTNTCEARARKTSSYATFYRFLY